MSQAMKDIVEDEREQIIEGYCCGKGSLEEAVALLMRLGFDAHEARDMLQEAAA